MASGPTSTKDTRLAFETIRIEGLLLQPEWLAKIARRDASSQEDADYHIPKGLNLRDEIGRYWHMARPKWTEFAAGQAAKGDARVLSPRFILGLLKECLGFTSVSAVEPVVIVERTYPIGFSALGGRVPVVIASAGAGLDTLDVAFGEQGRKRTAFGLVQELLNAAPGSLWGLVTDGRKLRIVRDNASLTRPAWIEVDLARIFTEDRYADFAAFWLLVHETRFGRLADDGSAPQPADCPLEAWREAGRKEGVRAQDRLRDGVKAALLSLGNGFLAHPDSVALRGTLTAGTLSKEAYFQQLLRLVYRLIFLLTAEERELLHPADRALACDTAKQLYARGYSVARLRERAVRRTAHDRYSDQWQGLRIVFRALASGEPRLGLPALLGLFAPTQTPDLDTATVDNSALMSAMFALSWIRQAGTLSRVNWRDMGPEELGSVYESLLELVPVVSLTGATVTRFHFASGDETKGNARKTSGSYYTPDSLVQVLLDSALEPVIAETIAGHPGKEVEALLSLAIVDPACGSGHFLLSAARRLAVHVARLRVKATPSAPEYRHALRQVIARCIYGVDLNPMAVELCRVALWMEAMEPGRPLTFLEAHIQHGNALLGTTPELMEKGIPDAAWDPIEGDDRKVASALKKRNSKEATGQTTMASLWSKPSVTEGQELATAVAELDAASDEDAGSLVAKESRWAQILASGAFRHQKFVADAWCAAFVWPKPAGGGPVVEAAPTMALWRDLRDERGTPPVLTVTTTEALAEQYDFFHWHLAFPTVFARGGFDVVLGNPPWVRQELLRAIKPLLVTYASFSSACDSSVYFLELAARCARFGGRVALLTPNKWFRANYASGIRTHLTRRSRVDLIIDFGHAHSLFPDADTFPAAVVFSPVPEPVGADTLARFVRAHDSDRASHPVSELVRAHGIGVAHGDLRPERWQLEDTTVSALLDRLLRTGHPLVEVLRGPITTGLKAGFNQAYYVDSAWRDSVVASQPEAEPLIRQFLRGRDVGRWAPAWDGQWHISIPSSGNRRWPWSDAADEEAAEGIFATSYPAIYSRMKGYEHELRSRQDRGTYWWELRSCDYYTLFDSPKIVVQCIAYYSQFALDQGGHYINNKVIVMPTDDLFLLAVLNSRVTWWIMNRTFQHMKDDGLSVDVQFLKRLPIPDVSDELRAEMSAATTDLVGCLRAGSSKDLAVCEVTLNKLVERAFALTEAEQQVLAATLPPRDPLAQLEHDDRSGLPSNRDMLGDNLA